jgi:hypothetical protein
MFLFTDIEGSTRRWEGDPEAMRAAVTKHDEVPSAFTLPIFSGRSGSCS